jgi:hypothetical protein
VKQTIEVGVPPKSTKHGAGHVREDQAWSERHGIEQWMPATCFATPSFLFAEPVLRVSSRRDRYTSDQPLS